MWEFAVEDGLVLARPDFHGLYILNPAARLLWRVLSSGGSPEAAVQSFVAQFDIPPEAAEVDVHATISAWSDSLLARNEKPPVPPVASPSASNLSQLECLVNGAVIRVFLEPGQDFTTRGMLQALATDPSGIPTHSTRFLVIDREGRIRKTRNLDEPELVQKLLMDIGSLLRDSSPVGSSDTPTAP